MSATPKRAELVAAPFRRVLRELPLALPRFAVDLLWHRRVHQDGGNRWLREPLARWFGQG